jgi:hypothetical protein
VANNDDTTFTKTYAYDPGSNTWSPKADLPIDLWGSASAAANGRLLISGGVTDGFNSITNQGYAYDPAADTWTALPNANQTRYRAGSACGLYRIGGNPGGAFVPPVADGETLPGFNQCGSSADVPWLSESATELTVAAGKSAKVTVTLNAGNLRHPPSRGCTRRRSGSARTTPYTIPAVPISLNRPPPEDVGQDRRPGDRGDRRRADRAASPSRSTTWATSYTLKTDAAGKYQLWLDTRNKPAAADRRQGRLPAADQAGEDHQGRHDHGGLHPQENPDPLIRCGARVERGLRTAVHPVGSG